MSASECSPGTHTIFFRVKDDDGAGSIKDIEYVTIEAPNEAPIANFTYLPEKPVVDETTFLLSNILSTFSQNPIRGFLIPIPMIPSFKSP
ncbi:MAG: hypothetical protein SYNGOMJ08_00842 [Candidatus Syntrophoarchaeum sp. GoM_oil]|nr:MAG: hypothetical protein SYNGOMJ08_00842 [Candidatus Syntrophoarchaeum sp. GoM_oil]